MRLRGGIGSTVRRYSSPSWKVSAPSSFPRTVPDPPPPPSAAAAASSASWPGSPTAGEAAPRTFVSAYYQVPEQDMVGFLQRRKLVYRTTPAEIVLKECPACPPHRSKPDNLFKLYVNRATGAHFCHRCGTQGSWYDLKELLGGSGAQGAAGPAVRAASAEAEAEGGSASSASDRLSVAAAARPGPPMAAIDEAAADLQADAEMMKYLTETRGLAAETVRAYCVGRAYYDFVSDEGRWVRTRCFTFPWLERGADGVVVARRVKARGLHDKSQQRLDPAGGAWGLFGWHLVPDDADELVLTEGEFDAMAVHSATGLPAVSLPNGARSLPLEVLPWLERFRRIYLWMDDDVAGQEGAAKFSKKLGTARCFVVPGGGRGKDANDALRAGADLREMLRAAAPAPHKEIVRLDSLLPDVLRELQDPAAGGGRALTTLPSLNRILKGLRRGELTVVTGATGVGKTTFLGQLALDYCESGVGTLWGSFEIKNARLARKMLMQHARVGRERLLADWPRFSADFAALPMYFMRFFGSTTLERVLDAMDYSAYVHDVGHVILDNLQFMTSGQALGTGRFDLQDRAVEEFRRFATERDVHVTLVIHPRKQDEGELLNTASVFGSAKATQEADNVLILQKGPGGAKYVDVRKNRFDGALGRVPLKFDAASGRFAELALLDPTIDLNRDDQVVPAMEPV